MHFKTDVIFWLNLVLNIRSHKWHFWQKIPTCKYIFGILQSHAITSM